MPPLKRILAGVIVLTLAFAVAALFSNAPSYRAIPPQSGILKLSFSHAADRRAGCRQLTAEEIGALAPNMRRTEICPRRRPRRRRPPGFGPAWRVVCAALPDPRRPPALPPWQSPA